MARVCLFLSPEASRLLCLVSEVVGEVPWGGSVFISGLSPPAAAAAAVASVMSSSVRPHRQQPTRLLRPWASPGKNTGVGCHFLLQCRKVKSESCNSSLPMTPFSQLLERTQACPLLARDLSSANPAGL